MVKKISPLAPKSFPKVPDIKGVKIGTAKSGVKYKGRNDIFTAIFDKGTSVAGVFTQSKIPAEPVNFCKKTHTLSLQNMYIYAPKYTCSYQKGIFFSYKNIPFVKICCI